MGTVGAGAGEVSRVSGTDKPPRVCVRYPVFREHLDPNIDICVYHCPFPDDCHPGDPDCPLVKAKKEDKQTGQRTEQQKLLDTVNLLD